MAFFLKRLKVGSRDSSADGIGPCTKLDGRTKELKIGKLGRITWKMEELVMTGLTVGPPITTISEILRLKRNITHIRRLGQINEESVTYR